MAQWRWMACWLPCLWMHSVAALGQSSAPCQFHFVAPRVGDASRQSLDFLLDARFTIKQRGRQLYQLQRTVERNQSRRLAVLETAKDRVMKVQVEYTRAHETQIESNQKTPPRDEPVAGKSYIVERQGESLVVTDPLGKTPTAAEVEFVTRSMDAVGRTNVLAQFLHGRTMAPGETVELPKEAAAEFFGYRDAIGEVASLKLTLVDTLRTDSGLIARMHADMTARSPEEPAMAMEVAGEIQIDPNGCRLLGFNWEGPVMLTETRGEGAESLTLSGLGTIAVEMQVEPAANQETRHATSSPPPRR